MSCPRSTEPMLSPYVNVVESMTSDVIREGESVSCVRFVRKSNNKIIVRILTTSHR